MTVQAYDLTDGDRGLLHVKFILPLAVGDILKGREDMDDVTEYMMHDVLGALQPDTALLCIALCAQNIADHAKHLAIARVMGVEAERIVNHYGPLWMAFTQKTLTLNDAEVQDILADVPEDLEELCDLMGAVSGCLIGSDDVTAMVCDILAEHADIQRAAAEDTLCDLEDMAAAASILDGACGDNVVLFPGRR